jgi:hypothetical protein
VSQTRNYRPAKQVESGGPAAKSKRPYMKPDFQHEKVFETMALSCGKISPTQAQCHFSRKVS